MSSNNISIDKHNKIITKKYIDNIAFNMEKFLLTMLQESNLVPYLITIEKNMLVLKYVEGESFYEILEEYIENKCDKKFLIDAFQILLNEIYVFEKIIFDKLNKYVVLKDCHLKKFIYTNDKKVVFIDLKEWYFGEKFENYSNIIAWIISCDFKNQDSVNSIFKDLIDMCEQYVDISKGELKYIVNQKVNSILKIRKLRRIINNTTAVLMCGGKSSRMNYVPKQTLKLGNFTFIEHILHSLSIFDNILISSNDYYKDYNVVEDKYKEIGPIGGIYSAMEKACNNYIFVVGCDMPNISEEFIIYVLSQVNEEDECIIPVINGQENPLCAVYKTTILPTIERYIKESEYRLKSIYKSKKTKYIDIPKELEVVFLNVNTPEIYKEVVEIAKELKGISPLTFSSFNL